jgi:HEAT repeat protein
LRGGELLKGAIVAGLTDDSGLVRKAAARAAGLSCNVETAPELEKIVINTQDELETRAEATRALARTGSLSSVMPLIQVLVNSSEPEEIRLAAADAAIEIASRHKFARAVGKFEANERAAHLAVMIQRPDPRWEALKMLVEACADFKTDKLRNQGFELIRTLAGRKLAPKQEIWTAWLKTKQEEARTLGEISYLVEEAYRIRTAGDNNKAYATIEKAMLLSKELLLKSDAEDKDFFEGLFADLCGKIGKKPDEERKVPLPLVKEEEND